MPLPAILVEFRPAITRRQRPPSPLPRHLALAAGDCGLWIKTATRAKPARPLLVGAAEARLGLATQNLNSITGRRIEHHTS